MKILPIMLTCLPFLTQAEELRDWTNKEGQTIRATFVDFKGDQVVLKMKGETYPVPLASLSQADRDHLTKRREEATAAAEKPAPKPNLALDNHISGPKLTASDVTAKPLVIHAWMAHCGACPPSLQEFDKYVRRKKRLDTTFLVWHSVDTTDLAKSRSEELDLDATVYHGPMIMWDEEKFGELVWPHLILMSPAGEVVYMGDDERELEDKLDTFLE
jgi:hypothetical protein